MPAFNRKETYRSPAGSSPWPSPKSPSTSAATSPPAPTMRPPRPRSPASRRRSRSSISPRRPRIPSAFSAATSISAMWCSMAPGRRAPAARRLASRAASSGAEANSRAPAIRRPIPGNGSASCATSPMCSRPSASGCAAERSSSPGRWCRRSRSSRARTPSPSRWIRSRASRFALSVSSRPEGVRPRAKHCRGRSDSFGCERALRFFGGAISVRSHYSRSQGRLKDMSKLCAALLALVAIFAVSVPPAQAQTQAWPQQPVRFILPFGPGAGADIGARLIQDRLQARWGKPVVIENRPGGDSMIAIQAVLSANDDHTFLWGPSGSFIVHPYQYKKLPYDPADLVPVARFSSTILGVGVPASMNIATLADFVKRARAEAGKFNSAAVPGITELAFDYFAHNAKITTTKVPYKDIVQAVNDLAEDRLQVYSASYAILRPQREAGRITVLAQMGRERAPSLLDIPTGIEAGFPELEMDGNVGLFGSKALPADLRERIGADVVAVSDDKAIDDKLNATAQTPSRGGAKEFVASIERQRAQIATIAKTLGIQPTR